MKTNLLAAPHRLEQLQQPRWALSIYLGMMASSLLMTLPGLAQTQPSPLPDSNWHGDASIGRSRGMPQMENRDRISTPPSSTIDTPLTDDLLANELHVPLGNRELITAIHIRFINEAGELTQTAPSDSIHPIISQDFDLQPGDRYQPDLALASLTRIAHRYTTNQRATLALEPTDQDDQVVMAVTLEDPNSFFFTFDVTLPRPTALQGTSRPATVPALANGSRGFSASVRLGLANIGNNNQTLSLGIEGGENVLGADLDFRQVFADGSGYGLNVANQRSVEPEFTGGAPEVNTPSGDEPWVHRIGGGVEYFRPLAPALKAALGLSYQQISVREDVFSDDIAPNDALGNDLTVSNDGTDDLLTINLAGILDHRNDPSNPTDGSKLLFGLDQSIPVGDADILFTRLSANYTQFLPVDLFGFTAGPRTLVLNLQGGTILGEAPPYDAFSLGGSSSVRGYGSGEIGTGESFLQATAEYRFPMFSFNAFDDDIDVGGTLFFDYASDLGTGDQVIGQPGEVRNKPGDGFGYGVGIRALTSLGPVRLELGINDEGNTNVIFNIGDRF